MGILHADGACRRTSAIVDSFADKLIVCGAFVESVGVTLFSSSMHPVRARKLLHPDTLATLGEARTA